MWREFHQGTVKGCGRLWEMIGSMKQEATSEVLQRAGLSDEGVRCHW